QAPNAQDEQGPDGWKTGGVYRSEDGGTSWTRVNSLNPRPMYFSVVKVDPTDPKYVYVLGVSQYKSSDGGKTFTANAGKGVHADGHAMSVNPKDGRHMLIGCDGFVCRVDPADPDLVYSESQGGAMSRRNLRTGERATIRPVVPGGGKGGKGGKGAENPYRWNWNTPFILSHHNPKIFYCAGNFV